MSLQDLALPQSALDDDHAALVAACEPDVGLCTIVGIEGSFSRRLGAQLAVLPDGSTVGSLADGCLEAQLSADVAAAASASVVRYGHGSRTIDFRLPCGGGLDILVDPDPDRRACRDAVRKLEERQPARLDLAEGFSRRYLPPLRLVALGEGPEMDALEKLSAASGVSATFCRKDNLALGRPAAGLRFDAWTACLLLFHDHEWELALLEQALAGEAFYIGAQGGEKARTQRALALAARGIPEEDFARVRSPIGLIPACKTPSTLALSALAEVVGEYERLRAAV